MKPAGLAAIGVSLLLAACAHGSGGDFAGTRWTPTSFDGAAIDPARASMEFRRDALSLNVGCNTMSGSMEIRDDRIVITGPLASTRVFCEGLMERERAVADMLRASPRVMRDGETMTIETDDHRLLLRRAG